VLARNAAELPNDQLSGRVVRDLAFVALAVLPVSIGVGILKYHLYDIDRIISRTLAYALVTGLLVGAYAGLVLLATQVFRFHSTAQGRGGPGLGPRRPGQRRPAGPRTSPHIGVGQSTLTGPAQHETLLVTRRLGSGAVDILSGRVYPGPF
jgi:hypothetical protein